MKSAFEILKAGGAIESIVKEHERQTAKNGQPDHEPGFWLGVLGILFDSLAKNINAKGRLLKKRDLDDIRVDVVLLAEVAVEMIESLDRRKGRMK